MAAKPPKPPATLLKQKSPIINSDKSVNTPSSSNNNNNNSSSNCNDNDPNNTSALPAATTPTPTPTTPTSSCHASNSSSLDDTFSKLGIRRYNSRDNLLNNISNDNTYNSESNGNGDTTVSGGSGGGGAAAPTRPPCNCTNISIMHLFHEMKQEFPTIPDPIVAQCVNENCHQRENCIQMLKKELALNPIPVQTYPAKVLQQHHINQQQQHNNQQQQLQQKLNNSPQQQGRGVQTLTPSPQPQPPQRHKNASSSGKPATPLRPIRAAPTQPPQTATLQRLRAAAEVKNCAPVSTNCDSVNLVQNSNNNTNNNECNISSKTEINLSKDVCNNSVQAAVCSNNSNNSNSAGECAAIQTCDMPATVTATSTANAPPAECMSRSSDFIAALNKVTATPPPSVQFTATRPRPRPNTLDLHASHQQLNKQLQQHLQQRSQLHQQQQQQQQQLPIGALEETPPQQQQKPIRKAPLPPIAPKPVFHNNHNHNNNQYNYNNNNSCGNSPQSQSGGSLSAESNLTSPISSCGESEISTNIGLPSRHFALGHINNNNINRHTINNNNIASSASTAPSTYQHNQQRQHQQQQQPPQTSSPLKSPIRHRSVITVQPEPPYTRSLANAGGSGSSTPTSQKSFTSVNLTLRQPTAAVPQSTIDISAGPASSGYGSGLTYSSTSYDARRGYQQNFHITVTDEGGVFNASRIRPRNSAYRTGIEERDSPGGPTSGGSGGGSVRQTVASAVTQQTQQQSPTSAAQAAAAYMLAQNITQQQAIQSTAAITSPTCDEMCVPLESSAFIETIKRQKGRRDKLATALRENKKKLGHVEEEINMLTEDLSPAESERLDYEIERLRCDCQQMLNEIENIRRYGQLSEAERLQLQQQQLQQQQQQQQQQPFPRQRPPRPQTQEQPQSPYQYQQPELDHLQQQQQQYFSAAGSSTGSGGGSGHNSAVSTPNSTHLVQSPNVYQQQQRQDFVAAATAAAASQHQHHQSLYQQPPSTDEEEYSDSNTDGGDDDDEPLERWPCSMCTFLNHPQLNICEACECVRILPGTVRIVPSQLNDAAIAAATASTFTPTSSSLIGAANSATAAAAAAALAAAAPTALGQAGASSSGRGSDSVDGVGAGAVGGNERSAAAGPTTARPVAAE